MSNIVNLHNLKTQLKNKWLDYWAENRNWMVAFCNSGNKKWYQLKNNSGDNECRPPSQIILATIAVLVPEFSQSWLEVLCELNGDEDKLIEALGLNFDPDVEFKKREEEKKKEQMLLPASPLDDIRQMELESEEKTQSSSPLDEFRQGNTQS